MFFIGLIIGFILGMEVLRYGVLICAKSYGRGKSCGPGIERLAALFRGDKGSR